MIGSEHGIGGDRVRSRLAETLVRLRSRLGEALLPARRGPRPRTRPVVRLTVTAALLGLLAWSVDVGEVLARLSTVRTGWLVVAAAVSVAQFAASAWRWRYTASRLGMSLPFSVALREYYLATFLNQVLPGGVLGDVSRAWRHAASAGSSRLGPPARAVFLERASGQAVMVGAAAASVALLPLEGSVTGAGSWLLGAGCAGAVGVVVGRLGTELMPASLLRDTRRALFTGASLPLQLSTSLMLVCSYVGLFWVAALAVGVETPPALLLPLAPPVLMAMLVPLSFAGWGLREGAAAALWAAVGLPASEGVAVSVAYGLLVLVTSLPGALILLIGRHGGPDRRARPARGGSDGTEDAGRRRGRPRAAA